MRAFFPPPRPGQAEQRADLLAGAFEETSFKVDLSGGGISCSAAKLTLIEVSG